MKTKALRLLKKWWEEVSKILGHKVKISSVWRGWEPRAFPVLHLPGWALPGKASSSQTTPWQDEEPGVLKKLSFFSLFCTAFSSAQTKPQPRGGLLHVINTVTNTWWNHYLGSGFYTTFYWCCYTDHKFCIIDLHMCKESNLIYCV